jgi:hypothetical protein
VKNLASPVNTERDQDGFRHLDCCPLDTAAVLRDIDGQIGATSRDAAFVYAFYGSCHDDWQLQGFLTDRFPQAAILGGTSCLGMMNQARPWARHRLGF